MSWTAPITWIFKQVWTASLFNQQIRDNLLYLKERPYDLAELGSSNQGSISTAWVKVTNSDLQIVVPVTGVLQFGWRFTFSHSVANNHLSVDIFDIDNNVYLSSGTATPTTGGIGRMSGVSTLATLHTGNFIKTGVSAGTHNYEFRVLAQAASATLLNATAKNAVWVKEIA